MQKLVITVIEDIEVHMSLDGKTFYNGSDDPVGMLESLCKTLNISVIWEYKDSQNV